MNRIYKTVWNQALGQLVAVPEVARSRGGDGRHNPARTSIAGFFRMSAMAAATLLGLGGLAPALAQNAYVGYEYGGSDYCVTRGATTFSSACSLWQPAVTNFTGKSMSYLSGDTAAVTGGAWAGNLSSGLWYGDAAHNGPSNNGDNGGAVLYLNSPDGGKTAGITGKGQTIDFLATSGTSPTTTVVASEMLLNGNGLTATGPTVTLNATNGQVVLQSTQGVSVSGQQIHNLAAGTAGTDAVNLTQLQAQQTHYFSVSSTTTGAGSNYANDGATGLNALAAGVNAKAPGQNDTAVGSGAKTSGTGDATAIGSQAQAIGQATAVGLNSAATGGSSTAIGNAAKATQSSAAAVGSNANAFGVGTVAFGSQAQALRDQSVAIGLSAKAGNPAAGSTQGVSAVAIGFQSQAIQNNTVALGAAAIANNANDVALGSGSTTAAPSTGPYTINGGTIQATSDTNGVVSIGSSGKERQIQNLAAGTVSASSTDAVNGSQLFAVGTTLNNVGTGAANAFGGGASFNTTTGAFTGPSYMIGGTSYFNVGSALSALQSAQALAAAHYYSVNDGGVATKPGNFNNDGAQGKNSLAAGVGASTASTALDGVALGYGANVAGTAGDAVAIGTNASVTSVGAVNDTGGAAGTRGIAIGLNASTTMASSIAMGYGAAVQNTAASSSAPANAIAIGTGAAAMGNSSIAIGSGAGSKTSNGFSNVVVGVGSGQNIQPVLAANNGGTLVSGSGNAAFGNNTGNNVTGGSNAAFGSGAGNNVGPNADTTQSNCAFAPFYCYGGGGNGSNNVAFGNAAGSIVAGSLNTGVGWRAGASVNGFNNVGIGPLAGYTVTGSSNVGIGSFGGAFVTGMNNTGVGNGSGGTVTGNSNAALGNGSGGTVTGNANAAFGNGSGGNVKGNSNAAFGDGAGNYVTGTGNLAIGPNSGSGIAPVGTAGQPGYVPAVPLTVARSTAIGNSAIGYGNDSIAMGTGAVAGVSGSATSVANDIAIGNGATAAGGNSIAVGTGSTVMGAGSGAFGDPNKVYGNGSYAFGNGNTIGATGNGVNNAFVMGNNVTIPNGQNLDGAVVLGNASAVTAATLVSSATVGGITYGGFAGSTPAKGDVVSVGSGTEQRQIQNVAAGQINSTSTDAINGSQLYATNTALGKVANSATTILGGNAALGTDGTLTMSNVGGTGKNSVNDAIAAASAEVKAGTNVASVAKTIDATDGHSIYTVNANGAAVNNTDGNLTVAASTDANNLTTYTVGLANSVTVGSGAGTHPITINGTAGTITGLTNQSAVDTSAPGYDPSQAASQAQVAASQSAAASAGLNFQGDQAGAAGNVHRDLGQTLALSGGATSTSSNANIGVVKNATGDGYDLQLAKNIDLGSDGSLTTGNTKVNNSGVTVNDGAGNSTTITTAGTTVANAAGASTSYGANGLTITPSGGSAVSLTGTGLNNGGNTITNVAAGVNTTDAANVGQVQAGAFNAQQAAPVVYTDAAGDKLAKANDGKWYLASAVNPDGTLIGTPTPVADANVVASVQSAGGSTTTATKLTNVANGALNSASTDAVNGSQLYSTNQVISTQGSDLVTVLGGNAAYNSATGALTMTNVGGTGKNNVNDAIAAVNTAATKPLTFAGDNASAANNVQRTLGQTLNVTGGATGTLTSGNIGVTGNGTDTLQVQLAQNVDLGSSGSVKTGNSTLSNAGLTANDGTNSTTYGSTGMAIAGGPSVTTTGIDAGGKTITNVASGGTTTTNAANIGDVQAAVAGATYGAQQAAPVVYTDSTGTKLAKANDGKWYPASAVSPNGSLIGTPTPVPTANVIASMQNAGGSTTTPETLTNVAAGALNSTSTDAVNGSQLNTTNQNVATNTTNLQNLGNSVATGLGGTSSYDATTGTLTTGLSVGGVSYTNVNAALNGINAGATAGWDVSTSVAAGTSGQAIVNPGNANVGPGGTHTIQAGNNIITTQTGASVEIGVNPNLTGLNSVSIVGGPTLNNGGIDMNGTRISNLAPGTAPSDAATVGQVNTAADKWSAGNPTTYVAPQATGTNSFASGSGAVASGQNSAALGSGSVADRSNSVSVGAPGQERQVTNVAPGSAGTDAVNVNQMAGAAQQAQANAQNYTDQRINGVYGAISDVGKRADAGVAGAMATASLPQPYRPGQSMVGAALGGYHGQAGIAVGVSTITDSGSWVFKANVSGNTQGNVGVGVGAGFVW